MNQEKNVKKRPEPKKRIRGVKTTTKKKVQTSSSWKSKIEKMNWSKAKKLVKIKQES